MTYLRKYSMIPKVYKTTILQSYTEQFNLNKTIVARDNDGTKYIKAYIENVNCKYDKEGSWEELPVHFYSDLPQRLELTWSEMQKRNMKTFMEYIKTIGTEENPVMLLTKVSRLGNRYFTLTTRFKYNLNRKRYANYSIETI